MPALERYEGMVGRVRAGVVEPGEATQVPAPRADGIPLEVLVGAELGDIIGPDRARVGAAKCRDPARQADPGASDDQQRTRRSACAGGDPLGARPSTQPA